MTKLIDLSNIQSEIVAWRHDFHMHPELQFNEHRTSQIVANKLIEFGCDEVVTGLAKTGVVGVIHGSSGANGRVIGLRADMDALSIVEETGKSYASLNAGVMHACGHDGHTSMLLGAAKYLSETRRFNGTIVLIFQPAEEGGGGAREMVQEGVLDRFSISEVYGLHNMPGMPAGKFAIREGAIMAAADRFHIEIYGKGVHAAKPDCGIDPILVGGHIITAAHSVVSRNVDPLKSAVLSFGAFNAGFTDNVIPNKALMKGTVRTLNADVQDLVQKRLGEVVHNIALAMGAQASLEYLRDYPITINAPQHTIYAADAAEAVTGKERVDRQVSPSMGAEDFAFMLQERPGAYIFLGQGNSASLHNPQYDFNDDIIPYGVSYWVNLAESRFLEKPLKR